MSYGDPELTWTACPACGCPDVFTALAPPGTREMPLYPACCCCGRERDDLAEFYANPPTQPRLYALALNRQGNRAAHFAGLSVMRLMRL
jgi:hypothetical protein